MTLIDKLKENNGEFTLEDFIDHTSQYEKAIKTILNNKEYEFAYKVLCNYVTKLKQVICKIISSYRPGIDYRISFYALHQYTLMVDKGIKDVVTPNKEEAKWGYLELLKRVDHLPKDIRLDVLKHSYLLLKYAYEDANDKYSAALNYVGEYYYHKKEYKTAFKYFKKGADFEIDGRQIIYPYYLVGKNQDRVGDMYKNGKGVKKNITLAKRYYHKCANNCFRDYHPKCGDFYLKDKNYIKAFLCYIDRNPDYRYNTEFMEKDLTNKKYEKLYQGLSEISNDNSFARAMLCIMHLFGLGCEQDSEIYSYYLPAEHKEWAEKVVQAYEDYSDRWSY